MTAFAWMREKLAALPRRAPEPADPPGVTVPASLVRSANLAAWMAYFALVYFLWLYTLDIARDRAGGLHLTQVGTWTGNIEFFFPYVVGFAVVAVGIPYVAKIAIPTFMSLDWRMNFWPKMWALFIATAVSLVVIAGTFTVQGDTLLERDRESAVAVDTVAQEAAVLTSRIADAQHRLDEMTRSESAYIRTAASMSPAAYDAFVEARRGDWQYERLVSYRAQAVEAEALRNQISELRAQQARQTVTSAVAGRVTTADTSWIAATLGWLEGARAILLSLVMDIVCLIMPWIALRLEQARNRQLATSAEASPASEAVMIEDLREEAPVAAEPMRPAKRRARDGETGDPLTFVEGHWRRTTEPKRAKPRMRKDKDGVEVEAPAGVIRLNGDEIGLAAAAAGVVMAPSVAAERQVEQRQEESDGNGEPERHPRGETENNTPGFVVADGEAHAPDSTTVTLDEETLNAIAALNADTAEDPDPAHTLPNNEGVLVADDEAPAPRRELVEEDA